MREYFMSLDCGKFELKGIGRKIAGEAQDIQKINFRSKYYDMSEGDIEVEGNSYKVTLDNKTYIIGEQGNEESYDTNKIDKIHKLCAYTAITKLLDPGIHENYINIVLACPILMIKSPKLKEEYKQYIKGNGEIHIIVDNKDYYFNIKDITLKAEGSGIVYLQPHLFNNKTTAIADLGGLNMGFTIFKNGITQPDDRHSTEHGANHLLNILSDRLTTEKGYIVSTEEADESLKLGYLNTNKEIDVNSIKAIEEIKDKYLKTVLKEIEKRGYKLQNLTGGVVFVGGTSEKIRKTIENNCDCGVIVDNAQWATVEGLYKVAVKKYAK